MAQLPDPYKTFAGVAVPISEEVKYWCSTSQIYPDTVKYM